MTSHNFTNKANSSFYPSYFTKRQDCVNKNAISNLPTTGHHHPMLIPQKRASFPLTIHTKNANLAKHHWRRIT